MGCEIGIVFYSEYPRNRGVSQLASALSKSGHDSRIVCRKVEGQERVAEHLSVPVVQLPLPRDPLVLATPIPFNPYWYKTLVNLGQKYDWCGLVVRETPLSLAALLAAKRLGIPAFLDMRENLSAAYDSGPDRGILSSLIRNKMVVEFYEALVVPLFNHVFTVTTELGSWVRTKYGVSQSSISELGNFPSSRYLKDARGVRELSIGTSDQSRSTTFDIVHSGWVMKNRGIQDVIRALDVLVRRGRDNLCLRVVGEDRHSGCVDHLKDLSKKLGVRKNVSFERYPEPGMLADTLAACDLGISSNILGTLAHQTIPGKLWEYMAVGLPVLSSSRRTVKRVIEETRCGRVYDSRDPQEIADHIAYFIDNPRVASKMGINGARAVDTKYNEDTIVRRLSERLSIHL